MARGCIAPLTHLSRVETHVGEDDVDMAALLVDHLMAVKELSLRK